LPVRRRVRDHHAGRSERLPVARHEGCRDRRSEAGRLAKHPDARWWPARSQRREPPPPDPAAWRGPRHRQGLDEVGRHRGKKLALTRAAVWWAKGGPGSDLEEHLAHLRDEGYSDEALAVERKECEAQREDGRIER